MNADEKAPGAFEPECLARLQCTRINTRLHPPPPYTHTHIRSLTMHGYKLPLYQIIYQYHRNPMPGRVPISLLVISTFHAVCDNGVPTVQSVIYTRFDCFFSPQ